jgi:PAS domain S-box-containing protein
MSLITVIWSMSASACLTLAGINFLVWYRNRAALANLLFSLLAIGTAAWTLCELWMMRAESVPEFATVLKWGHVAVWLLITSLVGFTQVYLKSGRRWLAWTVVGSRTFLLLPNFLVGLNLNYLEITRLGHMKVLGEFVAIADGVPNPWIRLGELNLVLFIVFLADATFTAWRRGDRHRALTTGAGIVFFAFVSSGQSLLMHWGMIRVPYTASISFMGLIAVMGYELSSEMIRASQLNLQLQKSEAGLHEIEERMRLAVEGSDFGIWTRDLTRNEIWATEKCRELYSFTETEPLELDRVLERIHFEDRDAVRSALEKATESGAGYETEYRVVSPTGKVRWITSRSSVELDGNGKPIVIRGVMHDITERKEAEQETQNLRQEIAHAGRVSMMGQLASALAHEINQPLGAILRNAEAAELFMQHERPDLDEVRAILADIRRDDQRAGNVIGRMRGLLKRQDLDKRPVDVGEIVAEVAALIRSDAAARHIKLELAVADGLPPVLGDIVHLQQVLLNLIVNGLDAIDETNQGDRRVSITAVLDGPNTVEIAVNDSGRGIPVERLTSIFDPFYTTKPNGLGMGLPISRGIIEAHHGRLRAENNKEGGASFRFTLPTAEESGAK